MKESKSEINSDGPGKDWQKSPHANLIRYVPSGIYFARIRIGGKLIRKSLKTDVLSTAQLRLNDLEKAERKNVVAGVLETKSDATFADAIAAYGKSGFRPVEPRNKDAKQLKPAALAYHEKRIYHLLRSWLTSHAIPPGRIQSPWRGGRLRG